MADLALTVKDLLSGADAKTVRSIALVVVDAMKRIEGEEYVLIPKNVSPATADAQRVRKGSSFSRSSPVKKPKKWGKVLEGCDYNVKPNGFAIQGEWANVHDLSTHADGTRVMVSVPSAGIFLGTVSKDKMCEFFYTSRLSGPSGTIKHFTKEEIVVEGDYGSVIDYAKTKGVPQYDSRKKKES